MGDPEKRGERTVALALLGAVLFSGPILAGFEADGGNFLFGVPSLFLYLFVAWGVLIGLLALVMESLDGLRTRPPKSPVSDEHSGPDSA